MPSQRESVECREWVLPPFGPVDEIVSNERPLDNLFSLRNEAYQHLTTKNPRSNIRSVRLQLLRCFEFRKLDARMQLFLEPRKVPRLSNERMVRLDTARVRGRAYECRTVSDMALSHSLELDLLVLHQLHVPQHRETSRTSFLSALASSIGDGRIAMLSYPNSSAFRSPAALKS